MANNGLGSAAMASDNVTNLSRISVGMGQSEILQIMHQPHHCETHVIGKDIYDVWFYVTRPTILGQSRMVPLNLTPLTFKNGSLIGWGYGHYGALLSKEEAPPPYKEPPHHPVEDMKLEKALKAPEVSMSRPSQSSPKEEEDEPALDEKDDRMIEEADEQNFDFW